MTVYQFKRWRAELVGAKFSTAVVKDKIALEIKENIVSVVDKGTQARNALQTAATDNYRVFLLILFIFGT